MITKEMVEYWLEENYHKWIANVIVDICNEPHDINHLKKQINGDLWVYLIPIICIVLMVSSWIIIAINS